MNSILIHVCECYQERKGLTSLSAEIIGNVLEAAKSRMCIVLNKLSLWTVNKIIAVNVKYV